MIKKRNGYTELIVSNAKSDYKEIKQHKYKKNRI